MKYELLIEQVKAFVIAHLKNNHNSKLGYHNLKHTQSVVSATMQISNHYQLNDEDFFAVCAAAWFHDSGYVITPQNHEDESKKIAQDFFNAHHVNDKVLKKILDCIEATKIPQKPSDLLQEILCDADLFHLGTEEFAEKSKALRKEVEALSGADISKEEWREKNILMLQGHRYHTDYCRLLLSDRVQQNLEKLKKKQEKSAEEVIEVTPYDHSMEKVTIIDQDIKLKAKKGQKRSKGVETMFRISASNQQRLSNMADSKAHIMISVNSIVISLLLSLLLRKIDEHPHQVIPAILLLTVNLITIVFAILATRPNITLGTFTHEDVVSRKVNLLFFGNFFKMEFDKYRDGMMDMINDDNFLYGSLVKDLYAQGVVLGRKYHLLRLSYNVFMYGLIVSVVAFVLSVTLT